MIQCGIYRILNTINNKFYIGSSVNLRKRLYEHRRLLRLGKHENYHLQNAFTKYGEENFKFEIIEVLKEVPKDIRVLRDLETDYIQKFESYDQSIGYNVIKGGIGTINTPCSEEKRQKISESNKGKSAWNKNVPMTAEQKQLLKKIQTSARGKSIDVYTLEGEFIETIGSIREANRKYCCGRNTIKNCCEGLTLPKKHIFVYHGDSLDIIAKNRVTISDEDKRLNIEKSRECRGYTVDVYNMSGELVDVVKGLEAASEKYGMISHNISKQMREKINGKGPYTFRHHNDFSVYVYSIYNNNDLLYRSFSKKCIREYLSKNKIRLGQAFSRLISESLTSISKYTYQIKYEIAHTGSNSGIESRQSEEINSEVSNEANGET